jgi:septal ring-binding cell division protein DamX
VLGGMESDSSTAAVPVPEFESESSVPADDLMGYDFDAPAAEQGEDLGISYSESVASAASAGSVPSENEGLGSLESLRNFELPAAQFPPIEDRIEPRQPKSKPLTPPPAAGGRKTGLIAAAAIVVVLLGAAAAWYYLQSSKSEAPGEIAQTAPPVVETSAPPVEPAATGSTTTTASVTSKPATDTSTPSATETTSTQAPAPATTTARVPDVKPVPPPVPQPSKPPTPVQSKPTVPAQTTTASASKFAGQAQKYASEAASVPFTVQFELVCKDASVQKAIDVGGSKIWFLPITYRGEQCYRVFWGRYSNRSDAERGASEIPASLRGGKPSVISPGASR